MLDFVHKLVVLEWGYPDAMCGATSEVEKIEKSTYRAIVLASMAIPVVGRCLDSYFTLLPASLKSVHDCMAHFGGIRSCPPGVRLVKAVLMMIAWVSFYGLLFFRNWAPSLAISAARAGVALSCFMGAVLQSGLGSAFADSGSMLSGTALILP